RPVMETPVVTAPVVEAPVVPAPAPPRGTAPILRRVDRRGGPGAQTPPPPPQPPPGGRQRQEPPSPGPRPREPPKSEAPQEGGRGSHEAQGEEHGTGRPVKVQCPNPACRKIYTFKETWAGKKGRCTCGALIRFPDVSAIHPEDVAFPDHDAGREDASHPAEGAT